MNKSIFAISIRLIMFVKPLLKTMFFSIFMGVAGHISAIAVMTLSALLLSLYGGMQISISDFIIVGLLIFAATIRGVLHYAEQYSGHSVAFKLLAKIRSNLFESLRKFDGINFRMLNSKEYF